MTTEEMVRRYNDGASTGKIAQAAGMKMQSVRNRLLKAGVKIRSAGQARRLARARGRSWHKFNFTMSGGLLP